MARYVSAGRRYNPNSFHWSEQDYTIRELVERFGHQLPFVIIVTQGYLGVEDWVCGVPLNEMQWIYGFARQHRVVVKDKSDRYYSIPDCYEGKVIPTSESGKEIGPKLTIGRFNEANCYKYLKFTDPKMTVKNIGQLQVIDSYDEKFLVAHVFVEETICDGFILIPTSVPIKMAIALASKSGGQKAFFTEMKHLKDFVDACPHEYSKAISEFAEVTVFKGRPQIGDYEYISSIPLLTADKNAADQSVAETNVSSFNRHFPVAHGIQAEDRLRQLKIVLQTGKIPEDDTDEVVSPETTKRSSSGAKTKSGLLTAFQIKKPTKPAPPKVKPKRKGIRSLDDVPSDLSALSVSDVGRCLELLNLSKHKEAVCGKLIDGEMLKNLSESILIDEFGFSPFEAKQLAKFAKGYRPKLD